jgi:hypothetical protein
MPLTDEQIAAMEAAEAAKAQAGPKRGLTDAEMTALEKQHAAPQQEQGFWDKATGVLKQGLDMRDAYKSSMVKGATLKYVDPAKFLPGMEQKVKDHPIAAGMGEAMGGMAPGILTGNAVGAVAPVASGVIPALGRIGLNTVASGATGLARKPEEGEDRIGNAIHDAKWGGGISAGAEGIAQLLRPLAGASKWVGRKLGGLEAKQAEAYAVDPKAADDLHKMRVNDKLAFDQRAKEEVEAAAGNLQKGYIDPRKAEITRRGVGKQVAVRPEQFKGTEAEGVIQDSWNKQGHTIDVDVPVFEPHVSEMSPIDTKVSYGKPLKQVVPHGPEVGYHPPEAEVSEVIHETIPVGKGKKPDALSLYLDPKGIQKGSVPKPMGETVAMTPEQALRAKRAASKASDVTYSQNPLAITAAEQEAAKRNAEAATNLGKAVKAQDPKIPVLDEELHEALSRKEQLTRMGNPSNIFNFSDTNSSVPVGSLRQFLDKNASSKLDHMADQLHAAKQLNSASSNKWYTPGRGDVAKMLLKGGGKVDAAKSVLQQPGVPQGFLAMPRASQGKNKKSKK